MADTRSPVARAALRRDPSASAAGPARPACKESHGFPGTGEETGARRRHLHGGPRQGQRPLPAPHVHALRGPELRQRLPGRRASRRPTLGPVVYDALEVHGLPLLHDRLPVRRAALRVVEARAARAQVRQLLRAPAGREAQRLRRGLPRRGDRRRHARGAAGRGAQAHRREPRAYYPEIYGENEVGGTSVLILSPVPFEQLGLARRPRHGAAAQPHLGRALEDPERRRRRLRRPARPSTGSPTGGRKSRPPSAREEENDDATAAERFRSGLLDLALLRDPGRSAPPSPSSASRRASAPSRTSRTASRGASGSASTSCAASAWPPAASRSRPSSTSST